MEELYDPETYGASIRDTLAFDVPAGELVIADKFVEAGPDSIIRMPVEVECPFIGAQHPHVVMFRGR